MKYSYFLCLFWCLANLSFANTSSLLSNPTNPTKKITAAMGAEGQLFVSSNTQSTVGLFDIDNTNSIMMAAFNGVAGDADGIFYDENTDVLYQLNRTDNTINAYSNVTSAIAGGGTPMLTATSSSDFINGREIAVSGSKLVVVQDAAPSNGDQNRFYIYDISPTSITLDKVYDVSINLWGIHLANNTLYAVEDNSNRVAVFNGFLNLTAGAISPDMMVSVDNLVRTHGITYDAQNDIMILTDIGDAASATDGALVVIKKFGTASADGTVSMSEQIRVFGGASRLGNPVDVAYDVANNRIYVAERARDGGRVLGFKFPSLSGGIAPVYNQEFAGASAIHFSGKKCNGIDGGKVSLVSGGTETTIYIDGNPDMISFNSTIDAAANGHSFTYVVTDAAGMILSIPMGSTVDFNGAGLGVCRVYGLSYTGNLNIMVGMDLYQVGLEISDICFDLSDNYLSVNRISAPVPDAQFFVSSNTQSSVGVFDIINGNGVVMASFATMAADADGIYYDRDADVVYQLNRTSNVINAYSNVSDSLAAGGNPLLTATSTSDFINGREIAVLGSKLIVVQDAAPSNGDQNRFYIYDITPTAITLSKIYDVTINLWGIHLSNNTLYAVEDNSNRVAVFYNFLDQMAGALAPDAMVSVDNLVRTHGLTYDAQNDLMILTDIGDAASATDGALVVVKGFTTASADGTIMMSEQIRVSGGASNLGNPVDVAFDKMNNKLYVAERANGGGRILGFNFPLATGGIAPFFNQLFAGASAINLPDAECNFLDGGKVSLVSGGTETTIYIDGKPDMISFASTVDAMTGGYAFTYVVTDAVGMILSIPMGSTVDFNGAGLGVCRVYGLSYTGSLNIIAGMDLHQMGLQISDGCFDLSDNFLSVNRITAPVPDAQFFVSSNTQSVIGAYDVINGSTSLVSATLATVAVDADGIYYDDGANVLYQLDRTDNVINAFSNVSDSLATGGAPLLTANSTADFINGRGIAVSGSKLVVAQDADPANGNQNRFYVYDISPTAITLDKVFDADINLWGIHLSGTTLYAVVDNSNQVAVYNNFLAQAAGPISPDALVAVDNLVRTHGLTYDGDSDLMVLTDIGDAASATDGALVVIKNFTTAGADGTVSMSEQVRVSGGSSRLGNPVDVALDKANNRIYVAERANGGGRILGFKFPVRTGGIAPFYNQLFAGASAIHLPGGVSEISNANTNNESLSLARTGTVQSTLTFSKLYPTPTSSELNLNLESTVDQMTDILVYDVTGALLQAYQVELTQGINTITFDVDKLNAGIHFVRIPAIQLVEKFVKID